MQDIHDIKPILNPGADLTWLIWAGAALLVLMLFALGWWLWQRRRKAGSNEPEAIPLPLPEEEAVMALDALAGDHSVNGKQYYFRLSAILRRYIERRYEFPAAEMTLEELLPRVDRLSLAPQLAQPLTSLCRRAEPVKFAGAAVDPQQMPEDLQFVRKFVKDTIPVVQADETGPDANRMNQPINESTD